VAQEKSNHISPGVILRTYASGKQALFVRFDFKGMRCTERLKVSPNQNGQKYAARLVGEIKNAIERKTFNYQEYFPDSQKAAMFGHSVSNETVGEAIETWLKDVKKSRKRSTYNTYRKKAGKLQKHEIWKMRKRDVTGSIIRNLVRGWDGVTIKTIRNNLIPLSAVLGLAVTDREIQSNPAENIQIANLVTRKAKAPAVDPFEYDELKAIIHKAGELFGPWYHNFVAYSFFQGNRTSETYGLMWPDIDWVANTAHIQRGVVEGFLEEETKTISGERMLDLTVGGYQALQAQKEITGFEGGFVFCRESGLKFIAYKQTAQPWRRVLKSLGIRWRQQYQTRHTYASHKLSHGENLFYMAKQMGHANPQMLLTIYGKYIESAKDRSHMPAEFLRTSHGPFISNAKQHGPKR
jgi:integrase